MQIKLRVLKAIQNAVQSITDCTSPVIEVGGIRAAADGLRSPYASHRKIEYSESDSQYGELVATSSRHKLLIQSLHGPKEFPYSTPRFGLMAEWQGGVIPKGVVQPVLDLAEELGLPAIDWREDAKLVRAYVLTPSLAAYHLGKPVFWLANDNNEPLEIGDFLGAQIAEIGGISLFTQDPQKWGDYYCLLSLIPLWNPDDRVGNVARDDAGRVDDIRRADVASVVAARYRGETVFLARVDGPATLVAEDGGRVTVDGYCVAIAPTRQMVLARV